MKCKHCEENQTEFLQLCDKCKGIICYNCTRRGKNNKPICRDCQLKEVTFNGCD